VSPDAHWNPHVPQLAGSLLSTVQIPLQLVVPLVHVVAQALFEQTWPVVHAAPHAPQLAGSLLSTVQIPLQLVVPPTH
jgi:hypothetical protein